MIFTGTNLYVADNSGGLLARCIKTISRPRYRWAVAGDILLVTIKRSRPNRKVRRGEKYRLVLVNTRSTLRRSRGQHLAFRQNAGIILKKEDLVPLASRLRIASPFELRARGFRRILTMSSFNI